jgi:ribosomal protein L11 methyltransferase
LPTAARHARIVVQGGSPELLERAAAEAFEAGALGIEERAGAPPALWIYALAESAARVCEALRTVPGLALGAPEPVAEQPWSEAWKDGLEPIVISPRLLIRPSFRPAPAGFRGRELVIDPGQAFGTGGHASTRLALEAIDALPAESLRGVRVLDVGCGSGVLALAALALGAARALGCDLDPLATAAAREAAAANGLGERLALVTGSLDALGPRAERSFGLVAANLLRRELEPLLPGLPRLLAPGARVVLSGLVASERTAVEGALAALALVVRAAWHASDPGGDAWIALLAQAPG